MVVVVRDVIVEEVDLCVANDDGNLNRNFNKVCDYSAYATNGHGSAHFPTAVKLHFPKMINVRRRISLSFSRTSQPSVDSSITFIF